MVRGKFISVEGGDGSGKTTQLRLLAKYLEEKNIPVLFTKEPGGTEVGKEIRKILLEGHKEIDSLTESLLFFADRRLHVENVIKPALEKGINVISDRFADTTYAFQKAAGGIDDKTFDGLYRVTIGDFKPDMTIYLDIDPELGLKRSCRVQNHETRMEEKGLEYHKLVRKGYLDIASKDKNRFRIIDKDACSTMNKEDDICCTFELIKNFVEEGLGLKKNG